MINKYSQYIKSDNLSYSPFLSKERLLDWILRTEQFYVRKYIMTLRKEEYYTFIKPNKVIKYFYRRRRNIIGAQLGFFIHPGNFKKGLKIYHYGSIIIHPDARIGTNCTIHGNCCIGSKGGQSDDAPVIGDNVDIGQGAQILGNITVANNVIIGAGAVVTKSILEENVIVVGIPAEILKK